MIEKITNLIFQAPEKWIHIREISRKLRVSPNSVRKYIPKLKRGTINIGKPLYFNKYYNKKLTEKDLRKITSRIMKEIAKLSNQRYNH